mgnify:FL=1
MRKTNILYAVRDRSHTGTLIKPAAYRVLKMDKVVRRIVLAPSIEEALLLTYPHAHLENWKTAKIKAYAIQPERRHSIHGPIFLANGFGFTQAIEFNEHACFSNLRMQEVGEFKIIRDSLANIDLLDELGNTYGKRFALF